ncbi:MAG: radical SAM protein [Desulfococcaceae bacterium]
MKVVLISMPDVAPVIIHDTAIHMPNLGIASVGGNIDEHHEVRTVDLIRKRGQVRKYLTRVLTAFRPDVVGLSAMSWQYDTCIRIIRLIREILPHVKIAIGGYHATLMFREIGASSEGKLIDFIIRGEGEEAFRRLVNALEGKDRMEDIPSLSFQKNASFVHNEKDELLDLSRVKLPIRDKRRLTWGYHVMYNPIEVMETSRGCTRSCNYCSIRHMYGRSFRTFPIERVLADLDDIYYKRKTRWVFVADDNLVLNPARVMSLCDAIIQKNYKGLCIVAQADCVSMSKNEDMIKKMAEAGFKSLFLGIENVSAENLITANKGNIVEASRIAVELCHKYGIMVIGGLVLGFPEDDENSLIRNFEFFNSLEVDAAYCQILTPYPKTGIREILIREGLVVNSDDFRWYNGIWANVRTRHMDAKELQYKFWYQKENVLGWWRPSSFARRDGKGWTGIWTWLFKPVLKYMLDRKQRKIGWEGRFQEDMEGLRSLNRFPDL